MADAVSVVGEHVHVCHFNELAKYTLLHLVQFLSNHKGFSLQACFKEFGANDLLKAVIYISSWNIFHDLLNIDKYSSVALRAVSNNHKG